MASNRHTWNLFRAGGFDQVKLETGADLLHLAELDQKLWVALACPATGLEFDPRTLALIDTDKDGRIRVPEILAATRWACAMVNNPDVLVRGDSALPLSAIQDATPEGQQLLASARQILVNLGKADAPAVSVEDVCDMTRIFAQTKFNGDGIVPAEATEDDGLRTLINDILTCLGAETDRSGKPGITQAKVDQFFAEASAYLEWWKKAETDKTILPLGEATTAAAAAVNAVRTKVDDYFARCRLAAFDARALGALNREEKEYLALAAKDLHITAAEIAGFPLARIEPGKPLPLTHGVNPAWAGALAQFHNEAVKPLLGDRTVLTETDWAALQARLAPYQAWLAAKAGATVERLGLPRVREILAGTGKDALTALIARDKALEPEASAIASVEKLVRLNRDLIRLLRNFVSFRDFYGRKEKAIFQVGTLYLDQRSCELCVAVEDPVRHAAMAGMASTYLAYCDCTRKATGEKRQIVAAFTNGDSDNLMVGRNGIFYDRQGRDWDATITRIIENPISIRQAFFAPYKKFVRMIEEFAAKRAAAAEAASESKLATTAQTLTEADKAKVPPAKPRFDVGSLAAIGLSLSFLLSALGGIFGAVLGLAWWQIPLAIGAVILAISLPSMVIAWLKLRKRNLGPILDANGWAVNANARMNVPFGKSLTQIAALPPGAHRDLVDPFAEKKQPWWLYITFLVLLGLAIAYWLGKLDRILPASLKHTKPAACEAVSPGSPSEPSPAATR